jgi:hypothetical protein
MIQNYIQKKKKPIIHIIVAQERFLLTFLYRKIQWFGDHQKASVLVKPIAHNFNTVSEKLEHYNIPTTKLTTQPFPKLKVITKIINLSKTQKAQL